MNENAPKLTDQAEIIDFFEEQDRTISSLSSIFSDINSKLLLLFELFDSIIE